MQNLQSSIRSDPSAPSAAADAQALSDNESDTDELAVSYSIFQPITALHTIISSSLFAGWFVDTGRLLLPAAGADATATRPLAAVGREED